MVLKTIERVLESRISPGTRARLQVLMDYAGETQNAEEWLSRNIILALFIAVGMSLSPFLLRGVFTGYPAAELLPFVSLAIFFIALVLFSLMAYFSLYFRIESRRKRTFDVLPDFLTAVSMNIHAGMEPMSALYVSLRSDFEPITAEMRKIRSLALGSRSVFEQLSMLQKTIDSQPLKRTLGIIGRALRSGGDLGRLLLSVADDLREMGKLQKELETATRSYAYFIGFLVLLGVPMLLGAVSVLIQIASKQMVSPASLTSSAGLFGGLPLGPIGSQQQISTPVSSELIFLVLIAVSTISASLMFGVLWHGEVKAGARYIPLMLPVSVILFFAFKELIGGAMKFLILG